jgi:hypothetical protein
MRLADCGQDSASVIVMISEHCAQFGCRALAIYGSEPRSGIVFWRGLPMPWWLAWPTGV